MRRYGFVVYILMVLSCIFSSNVDFVCNIVLLLVLLAWLTPLEGVSTAIFSACVVLTRLRRFFTAISSANLTPWHPFSHPTPRSPRHSVAKSSFDVAETYGV
jgi:hypothetical protein